MLFSYSLLVFKRAHDARDVHEQKFAILMTYLKSLAQNTLQMTYNMRFSRNFTIYVCVRAQRAREIKFWP